MTGKTGKSSIEMVKDRIDKELAELKGTDSREKQMILVKCRNLLLDYQVENGGI